LDLLKHFIIKVAENRYVVLYQIGYLSNIDYQNISKKSYQCNTNILSGEEHVITPSALLDLLHKILAESPLDTTLVADIKQRIINYLMAKYFDQSDFDKLINTASFLDPRVKTKQG